MIMKIYDDMFLEWRNAENEAQAHLKRKDREPETFFHLKLKKPNTNDEPKTFLELKLKKYDEDIIVGDGRLRPLELGPHDAATEPSSSDNNVYLVDRVLEVS